MSDKPEHAALPALCDGCIEKAHERAATAMDNWTLTWCPHRGTLAVGFLHCGRIKSWSMQGPLSDTEAQAHAKKILQVTKPAHAAPPRAN